MILSFLRSMRFGMMLLGAIAALSVIGMLVTQGQSAAFYEQTYGDLSGMIQFCGFDGLPEIVEEEAEVVRAIYKRFLAGDTICMITKKLNEQGIPSPAEKKKLTAACDEQEKKTKWCAGTVESILTNEKYKGDALLQKTYCTDFLTKKMKVNEGEVP